MKQRSKNTEAFTDFTWGSRSAIQKAIRRSDGPLLEDTFKELYEMDRDFLLRRISVFAGEECWPITGAIMDMVDDARGYFRKGAGPKARERGRSLLLGACRKICMCDKAKDAGALASLVYGNYGLKVSELPNDLMKKQFRAMEYFYNICQQGRDFEKKVWSTLYRKAEEIGTDYALSMIKACRYRYFMKGMPHEQDKFLAAAILVVTEYHEEPDLNYDTSIHFRGTGKERIPIWCWDQHTRIGRTAMHRTARDMGLNYDKLAGIWFTLVAAYINPMRKGEVWWPLRVRLVRETISDERWRKVRETMVKQIKKRLREEGVGVGC